MEFIAGEGNTTAGGFQLSLLSVPDDLRYVVDAAAGQGADRQLSRVRERIWGEKLQNKELLSQLVRLLAHQLSEKEFNKSEQEDNPLIVVEEG